jgi:hypothetical protein
MALNKDPIFGGAPKFGSVTATAANTALDGSGTVYTIVTAGADGAIVTSLKALARATVTATACRLFVSTDGGATKQLLDDKLMAAHTIANTTSQTPVTFINKLNPDDALRLPANAILYGSIAVALAGGIQFSAEYTDLAAA